MLRGTFLKMAAATLVAPFVGAAKAKANPLSGKTLYREPWHADRQAAAWRTSRPKDAAQMDKMASQPLCHYFSEWAFQAGGVEAHVRWDMQKAEQKGQYPVIGVYYIPKRDGARSGGAPNAAAYRDFVDKVKRGIAGRECVVILEPDGVVNARLLPTQQLKNERYSLIRYATETLAGPKVSVYVCGGNPAFRDTTALAGRLTASGVKLGQGFALNISNFYATGECLAYGRALSRKIGGRKHFVIDTSRNGLGHVPHSDPMWWCNPPGRALGSRPKVLTDPNGSLDAYLWLKVPGESDGSCRGYPGAGTWMPEYALGLAKRAAYQ